MRKDWTRRFEKRSRSTQDVRAIDRYAVANATPVSQTKSVFCGKREDPCSAMEPTSPSRGTFIEQNVVEEVSVPLSDQTLLAQVKTAGRLAFFSQNWEDLTSDPMILSTTQGYKIPFLSYPPPPPPPI